MLHGEAVVAIWNNITPAGLADFYEWHIREHIPERVDIPGFRRGRRYAAADPRTDPTYFTLYEVADFAVLSGADYAARLAAPTPWTRRATSQFRNTSRALARVVSSEGPGAGGALLTLRFAAEPEAAEALTALLRAALRRPRVCGGHLCVSDDASSAERTAESRDRSDIEPAPTWFALVEATDPEILDGLLAEDELRTAGARTPMRRGLYRLEYARP